MSTDNEIIARSLEEPGAFSEIFERHIRPVGAYIRRRVGADDGDDLVSETFLVAFRRRSSFDGRNASALPWLLGIATRLVKSHRAAEARQWQAFEASSGSTQLGEHPHAGADEQMDAEAALRALAPRIAAVGSVIAPVEAPSAAAAEVLEDAARSVLAGDSLLEAGQYTRIDVTTELLVTNAANGVPRDPGADAGFIERVTTVYYVPANRDDDWFIDTTGPREIVDMIGEGAEELFDRVREGGETRADLVESYPGGIQGGAPIDPYRDHYDTLSRDPERLLDWARGAAPGYESKMLMDLVWLDLAPKNLRSAAYQALALLPGFSVVGTDGDLTTLERSDDIGDGETLIATLVVDTASGQLRAYTSSVLQAGGDGIAPEGVPDMRMTFTSTVVDEAP